MKTHRITFGIAAALIPLVMLSAKPSVHLTHPPPGRYGIEDLWKATVTSDTVCDAWFEGFVYDQTRGQVFHATTKPFRLSLGSKVYQYRDVKVDKTQTVRGYEVFVTRSGHLPAGNYRFKLRLQPFGVGDSFNFEVKPMGPPRLISPPEGAKLGGPYPDFVWTAPRNYPGRVTYKLTIVEVSPGQTKEEALAANPPWFEQAGINSTRFRYPTRARKLDKDRKYAWQVSAGFGSGITPAASETRGFRRAFSTPPMKFINPLKVSREVFRYGNFFEVRLTLQNIGSQNITNIVATDSHKYFQCLDDAMRRRVPPPGGEHVREWTTQWENAVCNVRSNGGGFSNAIDIYFGGWVLPPGLSFTISYTVLPLLTFSFPGPGHTIGAGLKVTYKTGGNQHARSGYAFLAKTPVPGLADAWKAADYIISTCPSRLQGPDSDVDALLVTMARLAKARNGALLYFTSALSSAASARSIFKAFGTVMKNKWQGGYLLIVGEEDVVPHRPDFTDHFMKDDIWTESKTFTMSDYYYSNLSGDRRPEVAVGRIIGRNAAELKIPIDVSLSVKAHQTENDGSRTMMISGHEKIKDKFPVVAESGAAYLWREKATSVACWDGEYYSTAGRTMHKAIIHAPWPTTPIPRGADKCCKYCSPRPCGCGCICLNNFTDRQLAAWVLQEELGIAAFDAQYPPQSADVIFVDVNGRYRRVPAVFGSAHITGAANQAAQIEFARGGYFGKSYLFLPDNTTAHSLFVSRLKSNMAGRDFIVYNGHSGSAGWYGVDEATVVGAGIMSSATRPVAVCFGCSGGNYSGSSKSVSRAFLRYGAGAYIGATQMINTGDANRQVRDKGFLKHWARGKRVGDVQRDWKNDMAAHTVHTSGLDLRLLHVMNLYGDPKFGGD